MSNLEFIPVTSHTTGELREVGADIYGLLQKPQVVESLKARNLLGVVARHTVSPERSAESMESLVASPTLRNLQAFVIRAAGTEVTVGMATIQQGLELYRQRLPLPAKLTRKFSPLLSTKVNFGGANVSAWTDYCRDNSQGLYADMKASYKFLRRKSPDCWTLVPNTKDQSLNSYIDAISHAGFRPDIKTCWTRLDEGENLWTPAPLGVVFVSESNK